MSRQHNRTGRFILERIEINPERRDMQDRRDIATLVNQFYKKAMADEAIGFIFTEVAKLDLTEHAPKIIDFWDRILFGGREYQGNPLSVHRVLHNKIPLTPRRFQRWLHLFHETIDELFGGENAERLKHVSQGIAENMATALNEETADSASC